MDSQFHDIIINTPAILKGVAALVTAVSGAIALVHQKNIWSGFLMINGKSTLT